MDCKRLAETMRANALYPYVRGCSASSAASDSVSSSAKSFSARKMSSSVFDLMHISRTSRVEYMNASTPMVEEARVGSGVERTEAAEVESDAAAAAAAGTGAACFFFF